MLARPAATTAEARWPRILLGLALVARLARKRTAHTAVAHSQEQHEHTLANAVDWAVACSRHLYGPAHTVTPEDVQLRAWADFNLDVSLEEAATAITRYAGS